VLALCFWAIEVKGWRRGWTWAPLIFGSNAIAAYMISELLPAPLVRWHLTANGRPSDIFHWCFVHFFAWIPSAGLASFAYSFAYMAVCFVPVWLLYKKRIFLKV
jgi:predicted acyltransferase